MDLSNLEPVKTAVFIQLQHPVEFFPLFMEDDDGQPMADEPIGFDLVGLDSDEYAARQRFLTEDRLKKMEQTLEVKGRIGGIINTSAAEQEEQNLQTIAACVKGWRNIKLDGELVPYSHDNCIKVLRRLKWVREQVDKAIANRANFIRALPNVS